MATKNLFRGFFPIVLLLLFAAVPAFASPKGDAQKLIDQGFARVEKGQFGEALESFTQAHVVAEKNRLYDQQFVAKNNIGIIYFNLNDYGEALNYYLEAYTIAIKYLDAKREMTILNNIGTLYSAESDFAKGGEYFRRAYEIAKRENDKQKLALYCVNLARVANKTGKAALAGQYLEEAEPLIGDNKALRLQAQITKVENLVMEGQFVESRKLAFSLFPKTSKMSLNDDRIELLVHLADAYHRSNMQDSAIFYLKRGLRENDELEWKVQLFQRLSESYAADKKPWLALQFKDSVLFSKASLDSTRNSVLFANNKVKFEFQQYKNDLSHNQQRLSLERKLFFVALAVALLLLFLVYRLFRNRAIKNEQKRIIAIREAEIARLELEKEKSVHQKLERQYHELETETGLQQRKLADEIGQKNRQLSARALYLSGRNEMIEDLMETLMSVKGISDNAIIRSKVKALKEHLRTDSEWDNFVGHFEEVNQDFLHELKKRHPDLNANDIRFISYLYMNLSSKEIGAILNITPEAIRKRKERVSKKVGLNDYTSLYDYLVSIS
ncbi:tetratricopeptide repeat protein [Flavobacterium sp. MAH-1]|uniref:Tetratricopeptide repeat protein n=1 Tax=Flavobacterium agri TaxID=2743471 RepID=A0A7Y8Y3R9_9FLAO|nr:tetratricopeptide repeat protein [Flavobacterium agri]NUY82035.1 tetratricopeptide repeat protein [Flavobacterium agri]NYA72059.1 tetratricopeptide repeat protein [Flavobacterium agri]